MKVRTIYLSGPMTGIELFNHPAFDEAELRLNSQGHNVKSPHRVELEDSETPNWENFMRKDLKMLCDCDTIALLPGWDKSRGATLELFIATQLGMEVIHL
jgi:nucleoside 2-deoxyribosyltransferase